MTIGINDDGEGGEDAAGQDMDDEMRRDNMSVKANNIIEGEYLDN